MGTDGRLQAWWLLAPNCALTEPAGDQVPVRPREWCVGSSEIKGCAQQQSAATAKLEDETVSVLALARDSRLNVTGSVLGVGAVPSPSPGTVQSHRKPAARSAQLASEPDRAAPMWLLLAASGKVCCHTSGGALSRPLQALRRGQVTIWPGCTGGGGQLCGRQHGGMGQPASSTSSGLPQTCPKQRRPVRRDRQLLSQPTALDLATMEATGQLSRDSWAITRGSHFSIIVRPVCL